MLRRIVTIDEEKCDGCGQCVPSCAEGAIRLIGGKARLAADRLCDGLGACLGECPRGAIAVVEREAEPFGDAPAPRPARGRLAVVPSVVEPGPAIAPRNGSRLGQWPVQLHLVSTAAPDLRDADLLVAADCVPFAYARFHEDLLAGRRVLVGCPKLDDNRLYAEKLTELFRRAGPRSVTVARMDVPCCGGIARAVRQAIAASGRAVPYAEATVGIGGELR